MLRLFDEYHECILHCTQCVLQKKKKKKKIIQLANQTLNTTITLDFSKIAKVNNLGKCHSMVGSVEFKDFILMV